MAFTVTANADGAQTAEKKKVSEPKYTLQQFRVVGDLGAGSFGTVHKVVNEETGDPFAMKVLIRERVVQREMQEQLRREVLTQLRVKHINVVRLHYYFEDEAKIYCLLEYADGGQLFAYLRRQPAGVPESRAARLFSDTASGLAYLHSLRIVHRDLKPENILLFGQGLRAKICDFGWCAELSPEEPQRKTFCGTLEYLAPEMINNSPHDTSLDLWALGVLLYEMLMAKAPFTGESQKETVENICAVKFEVPGGSMSKGPEELIRGLLVLQGGRRMPLSKVLQHPWLAARPEGEGRATDDTLLDITRVASQRAKTPPRLAPADMGGLEATRIARRPQAHQGDQGALDLSGLEQTVTVPRRQQPMQRAFSARPADGSSDTFAGLEQTRVVPRRPRDGPTTAGAPPSPRTGRGASRPVSLDDTDPKMPSLQPVNPPRSGGAWGTSHERDSPQLRPDPLDVIRTEYAASCNPRPKERSSRRSSLASSTR